MLAFFTTVGLIASFKLLVKGDTRVLLFLVLAAIYLVVQNALGLGMALTFELPPLIGLLSGSITLSGEHGTGAAYAARFSKIENLQGVMELAMACATFGLVIGGLLGGPVAQGLIGKYKLESPLGAHHHHADVVTFDPRNEDRVTPQVLLEPHSLGGWFDVGWVRWAHCTGRPKKVSKACNPRATPRVT